MTLRSRPRPDGLPVQPRLLAPQTTHRCLTCSSRHPCLAPAVSTDDTKEPLQPPPEKKEPADESEELGGVSIYILLALLFDRDYRSRLLDASLTSDVKGDKYGIVRSLGKIGQVRQRRQEAMTHWWPVATRAVAVSSTLLYCSPFKLTRLTTFPLQTSVIAIIAILVGFLQILPLFLVSWYLGNINDGLYDRAQGPTEEVRPSR